MTAAQLSRGLEGGRQFSWCCYPGDNFPVWLLSRGNFPGGLFSRGQFCGGGGNFPGGEVLFRGAFFPEAFFLVPLGIYIIKIEFEL